MNECYGCTTCKSADKPLEGFIAGLPMETSHHRVEGQSTKCGFGLQGVCCRLCANGPCRITPEAPRGICGASADTIVVRNFLRAVASGSGCYIHVVENTALNVKNVAEKRGAIKGKKALDRLAGIFGIEEEDIYKKAEKVADAVLKDLYLPTYKKMQLVEKMAYAPRFKRWSELGILPGDVYKRQALHQAGRTEGRQLVFTPGAPGAESAVCGRDQACGPRQRHRRVHRRRIYGCFRGWRVGEDLQGKTAGIHQRGEEGVVKPVSYTHLTREDDQQYQKPAKAAAQSPPQKNPTGSTSVS